MESVSARKPQEKYTQNKSLTGGVEMARQRMKAKTKQKGIKGSTKSIEQWVKRKRKCIFLLVEFRKFKKEHWKNVEKKWSEEKQRSNDESKEVREDTSDRERQRKRKREWDYKSSRLPHHILYPPLVSHPPHPPTPSPPWSLTPGASPWQPDRVPNTWT